NEKIKKPVSVEQSSYFKQKVKPLDITEVCTLQSKYRVLVINPGSTSTKIGVFDNDICIFEKSIRHKPEDLKEFMFIIDQYDYRKNIILEELDYEGINISKLHAVCGRGGLLRPIEGGTYEVNEAMIHDLRTG